MGTGPEGFYGPSEAQIVSENATTLVYGIGHAGNACRLVVEVFWQDSFVYPWGLGIFYIENPSSLL
jgi:hypothetical protein